MKARVSIARAQDPYTLMEKILGLIDFGEKLDRESRVLIKPNLVRTPSTSGWALPIWTGSRSSVNGSRKWR